jgi:hypothetical protein
MSTEEVNTESDLEQLRPLLAKQHDHYREMLQEPIDNSISATVESEEYYNDPEPFTIQLDFERTPETCKVIVADAGHGMSREVIRDFVFSTGDTNYSNGILNNIGAGLKASICWCEESLKSAQGPSVFENKFHVLSKEPDADAIQRVDGPIGGGLTVYDSDDQVLWNDGAEELPHQEHGTRVHLTCASEQFNSGVANIANRMQTKMRYIQEELGVKFQHLLRAHEDNRIVITFRDIDSDGNIEEQDTYEVVPISPKFKAKPADADIGSITDYESYSSFEDALSELDESTFGEEQYGYASTDFEFEETGEKFYVSYEYGELDLQAMFDSVDAEERDLILTSPQTEGFRWRYKRNQEGTGVDIYGNGRILDTAEWVFDLTWNNQYNGYCGMVQIIPADPTSYGVPTTNDKTGIERGSELWERLGEWLESEEFKPEATYEEGAHSGDGKEDDGGDGDGSSDGGGDGSDSDDGDESDDEDGDGTDDHDDDDDDGTDDDGGDGSGSGDGGESGDDDGDGTDDGDEDGSDGGDSDGTDDDDDDDGIDDGDGGGSNGDGDGRGDSDGDGTDDGDDRDGRRITVTKQLENNGAERVEEDADADGVQIHLVAKYTGAGDVLHLIVDGIAEPVDVYRAMLYQDHYKRLDRSYEGTYIWATEASDSAQRDLRELENRRDEHGDDYEIELKQYA